MASALSRSYLGVFYSQPVKRSSHRITNGINSARCYGASSASVTKTKGPPSAKTEARHAAQGSVALPRSNAKTSKMTTPKSTSVPAKAVSKSTELLKHPHHSPAVAKGASATAAATTSASETKSEPEELSEEEKQVKQIENIMMMGSFMPTADPWGQVVVDTLDVIIPQSTGPSSPYIFESLSDRNNQFWKNRLNDAKNALSLVMLASNDSLPGYDLSNATWKDKIKYPFRAWTTKSVKPDSWLAPFREKALDTYKQLNAAIAQKNTATIKELAAASYLQSTLKLARKNKNDTNRYIWQFRGEASPTQVLSLRVTEGYLGREELKMGNRLMVHALVKFDTLQGLEIYDARGRPLHKIDKSVARDFDDKRVPAEPKRVTEYLVLEKRMWYEGPWVVREQMWETHSRKAAIQSPLE